MRDNEQVLTQRLEHARTEAAIERDRIIASCTIPMTRPQWALWLDENDAKFRGLMSTAHVARRAISTRIGAREGLPPPGKHWLPKARAMLKQ